MMEHEVVVVSNRLRELFSLHKTSARDNHSPTRVSNRLRELFSLHGCVFGSEAVVDVCFKPLTRIIFTAHGDNGADDHPDGSFKPLTRIIFTAPYYLLLYNRSWMKVSNRLRELFSLHNRSFG